MKILHVVGIGPGDVSHLTPVANTAIESSEELVAYGPYLDLLGCLTAHAACHRLPLGAEVERARLALDLAGAGRRTCLLSSGDAGIYAMASVVLEQLDRCPAAKWREVVVDVIPGVSVLQAAAARAGAPLGHDFCAISLSDLLTPWPIIERRVAAAAAADFVVALFNPVSHRRAWQLGRALALLRQYREPDTPTVVARNVARPGEAVQIQTLASVQPEEIDMLTILIVGSQETRRVGSRVYTPRGYLGSSEDGAASIAVAIPVCGGDT